MNKKSFDPRAIIAIVIGIIVVGWFYLGNSLFDRPALDPLLEMVGIYVVRNNDPTPAPPLPTATPVLPLPTAIPDTAQGRVDNYDRYLRWYMSTLLQDVQGMKDKERSRIDSFSQATLAVFSTEGLKKMDLPSRADFEAVGVDDYDPIGGHADLLSFLAPCMQYGLIGMNIETETLESLLEANSRCEDVLLQLKDTYPGMFVCPVEMGICD